MSPPPSGINGLFSPRQAHLSALGSFTSNYSAPRPVLTQSFSALKALGMTLLILGSSDQAIATNDDGDGGIGRQGADAPLSRAHSSSSEFTEDAMQALLVRIRGSQTVQRLLQDFQKKQGLDSPVQIQKFLRWGENSRTDAVLTRQFDAKSKTETRKREILIYLKRKSAESNLILDFVHELTHAVSQPEWDPYDPLLTPERYIRTTLEGRGGEVDAVLTECQAGRELGLVRVAQDLNRALAKDSGPLEADEFRGEVAARGASPEKDRCLRYLGSDGKFSRERIADDFYAVGNQKVKIERRLGKALPRLSSSTPIFYSSTGNAPYPVALLEEYQEINQVTCRNSKRRIRALAAAEPTGRGLASIPQDFLRSIERFISRRCRD